MTQSEFLAHLGLAVHDIAWPTMIRMTDRTVEQDFRRLITWKKPLYHGRRLVPVGIHIEGDRVYTLRFFLRPTLRLAGLVSFIPFERVVLQSIGALTFDDVDLGLFATMQPLDVPFEHPMVLQLRPTTDAAINLTLVLGVGGDAIGAGERDIGPPIIIPPVGEPS